MTEAPVRAGRPRNAQADEAIIDATLALLVEEGFAGVSMDAVAARAGVSKATIYRRWPSKEAVVIHALARRTDPFAEVPEGTARERLTVVLKNMLTHARSPMGRLLPCMVGATVTNPRLATEYRSRIIDPRRNGIAQILLDGIAAGELREDFDIGLAVDQVVGPLLYRVVFGPDATLTPFYCEDLVDALMTGLAARPPSGS